MELRDKNYSPGRKILLAKEHGFLPEESELFDYSFASAGRKMESLAELLRKAGNESQTSDSMKIIREELSSVLKILKDKKDTYSEKTRDNLCLKKFGSILMSTMGKVFWKKTSLQAKALIIFPISHV